MKLRRFTAADADALASLHGDPAVMRYIDAPVAREVVSAVELPRILREYDELPSGLGQFVVAAPEFAGWASLRPATSTGLDPSDVELGYRIAPAFWGRGLATAAAITLVARAFETLSLNKVVATTMAVNTGSRRVLEKAGLRHVRTFHTAWDDPLPGAAEGDVVYEIHRADRP